MKIRHPEFLFICLLLVSWWSYLFFTTQPILVFDGAGYQGTGELIYTKGLRAYLQDGPNREPLFPLLVAAAMWVGERCQVAYQYPLKLMGLAALLITMFFTHRLMLLLNINRFIAALGILYLGFSPTLLNSTLWLWSEFAAYPFVILAVWWAIKSWQAPTIKNSLLLATIFIGLMCVKAVGEVVIFLYLTPFIICFIARFKNQGWHAAKPWLIFIISVLLVFEGFVQGYKWLNLKTNGHYQFTDRGDWAFYSNTARRMEPLTPKRLGAAMTVAVDGDLCVRVFGYPDCAFWTARHSDDISAAKAQELEKQNLTDQEKTRYYIHQGLGMIIANPGQALLTMVIEAHKFFFWESSPNFVAYPDWMEKFIYNPKITFILKIMTALLCWAGFIFAAYMLLLKRNSRHLPQDEGIVLWFVFSFIGWYASVYSLFFVLDRYAFPLVPLMIILTSFAFNKLWQACGLRQEFRFEKSLKTRIMIISLLLLLLMIIPLISHIKHQHQLVKEKSKLISIEYYRPYFPYFASIATGKSVPEGKLMDGYHFGTAFTFHTYFKMAADSFPNNDTAQALLGFCQYHQGRIDQALISYEKALQLNPHFWWHNYNLAVIYSKKGDINKAKARWTKLLSLDPQASLTYIQHDHFYQQIWQHIENPGKELADHLKAKELAEIKIF